AASFHHSRVSAAPSNEGRYNVRKRKIYEDLNVGSARVAPKPCCWECFEATVERERVSAGLPARTAYLPEPQCEKHYENISFDESASEASSSAFTRHSRNRSLPAAARRPLMQPSGPRLPPRNEKPKREEEEKKSETYSRLCSIEFSKLHAADSLFSQERMASLQKKIERLLLIKSGIVLSEKRQSEAEFAKASNQVVYLIERRLRAIDAYSPQQFKKITAELISLLASAEKKQKSKMDTLKRGFARAVKVIF
ncbi:hypothetical protein PMAYCL1PPCAC_01714, partial [Pristionchus mayeri]